MRTTELGRRAMLAASLALVGLVCSASQVQAEEPAVEAGFQSIFNGKDLTGWAGKPEFWSVKDGAILGKTTPENPTKGNTFLIWKDGKVDNFELRLSYRIINGNSGIQYRSKDLGDFVVGGYQADIDSGVTFSGILYEERGRGILAQRGTKVTVAKDDKPVVVGTFGDSTALQGKLKKEDWNEYVLTANGPELTHQINGHIFSQTTDAESAKKVASGILALQLHAGPPMTIEFKNIRIKRLPMVAGVKKIVMVAGTPSHGPGDHEFNAGTLLLKKCLDNVPGVLAVPYLSGWPKDPTAFDNADAILFFADGGGGHPAIQGDRLAQLKKQVERGVGIACFHYAVEVPKDRGGAEFVDWIGGYFETHWSVNPHWTAKFDKLPAHPIAAGVKPFEINDEWYYHMRFRPEMVGVTPILSAVPPAETLSRPDGPHSGNPDVRKTAGQPQIVAWAAERADGGRGFGFTGGHRHANWADDNFRKVALNALVWVAKANVPDGGVESKLEENAIAQNLDPKGK
jgi:type 1 glutamine amidotransferase